MHSLDVWRQAGRSAAGVAGLVHLCAQHGLRNFLSSHRPGCKGRLSVLASYLLHLPQLQALWRFRSIHQCLAKLAKSSVSPTFKGTAEPSLPSPARCALAKSVVAPWGTKSQSMFKSCAARYYWSSSTMIREAWPDVTWKVTSNLRSLDCTSRRQLEPRPGIEREQE